VQILIFTEQAWFADPDPHNQQTCIPNMTALPMVNSVRHFGHENNILKQTR